MDSELGRIFEWGRLGGAGLWWVVPLAGLLLVTFFLLAWGEHRRTNSRWPVVLALCRMGAVVAVLLWFLQPRFRFLQENEQPSQLVVLVDTSASMLLPDGGLPEGTNGQSGQGEVLSFPGATRWQTVRAILQASKMWADLGVHHKIDLYTFDTSFRPVETLVASDSQTVSREEGSQLAGDRPAVAEADTAANDDRLPAHRLITFAADQSKLTALGTITPAGPETRLGEALLSVVQQYPHETLAAVVLISDGGQNAGVDVSEALSVFRARKIPVFTLGVGPTVAPGDLRVAQVEVPARVRPKDPFPVVVRVESEGYRGAVEVLLTVWEAMPPQLPSARVDELQPDAPAANQEAESAGEANDRSQPVRQEGGKVTDARGPGRRPVFQQSTTLSFDESRLAASTRFDVALLREGRYTVEILLRPQQPDAIAENNRREAACEVLDRPLRVLLVSGGPSREYQFLRSVLFRDPAVRVDVLLQSARTGAWQEADRMLTELSADLSVWGEYDCLVAVDPDWRNLGRSPEQIPRILEALERWIGDLGGGMIFVAGGIYAGDPLSGWRNDPRCQAMLRLLPVALGASRSFVSGEMYTSSEPWPLVFTPEGQSANYLWLEAGANASRRAWEAFPGVYSCLEAREPKRGATVLAYFGDPRVAHGGARPIYLAEHFYGAGRVLYIGSGELWRLRAVDERYYERLWLQLIRHVAQGRLAGVSPRLFVTADKELYTIGETVFVRARLLDERFRPVETDALTVFVSEPDGQVRPIRLLPAPGEPGSYRGPYLPQRVGDYRVRLRSPQLPGEEVEYRFRVDVSGLEERTLLRNESLLRELAVATGGRYFRQPARAIDPSSPEYLPPLIPVRSRTEIAVGPPMEPTIGELLDFVLLGRQPPEAAGVPAFRRWVPLGVDSVLLGLAVFLLAVDWLVRQLGSWTAAVRT